MNKLAVAFLTKDRVELSKRTVEPLLQPNKFDLYWMDGSATEKGRELGWSYGNVHLHTNIGGGADAAIVFALSQLLAAAQEYAYVGLCENDVLLNPDWFGPTMALFERGKAEGLEVGAVSARAFEDRILIQRDGYSVMHNLGAGFVIFTREAARIILDNYRNAWSSENRAVFTQLCGVDIARYWAFRGNEQWLTVDWTFDAVLASHGLASLALTPSPVEMIGQIPALHEQGLKIADRSVELLRDDKAFKLFCERTRLVRCGAWNLRGRPQVYRAPNGEKVWFAHQVPHLNGAYTGDWHLKWVQGFGPFAWKAGDPEPWKEVHFATDEVAHKTQLEVPVFGHCAFVVSGGEHGGRFEIEDLSSGYVASPQLPPDNGNPTQLVVPGAATYRTIRLRALDPGVIFHAIVTKEPQPWTSGFSFDHSYLPPV